MLRGPNFRNGEETRAGQKFVLTFGLAACRDVCGERQTREVLSGESPHWQIPVAVKVGRKESRSANPSAIRSKNSPAPQASGLIPLRSHRHVTDDDVLPFELIFRHQNGFATAGRFFESMQGVIECLLQPLAGEPGGGPEFFRNRIAKRHPPSLGRIRWRASSIVQQPCTASSARGFSFDVDGSVGPSHSPVYCTSQIA